MTTHRRRSHGRCLVKVNGQLDVVNVARTAGMVTTTFGTVTPGSDEEGGQKAVEIVLSDLERQTSNIQSGL